MQKTIQKSQTRAILMRKLMTICPVCGKLIFGRDIDLDSIYKSEVNNWPITYTHYHEHREHPLHVLTLYIDANFSVRDLKVPNSLKI